MRNTTIAVALGAMLCLAGSARADLGDGLINYWNFDQNLSDSAGIYVGNASTVADNGTFAGANGTDGIGYGPGLFGGAGIEQNGAGGGAAGQENDGVVAVVPSADTHNGVPGDLTVSMWFQTAGFDSSWQTLISHGEQNNWRMARRGGDSVAAIAMGAGDIPGSAIGPDISAGTGWHHIVGVSEAGVSMRIWVDGALVATGAAPTISDPHGMLNIGGNPDTGANNREWWGEIDDVAMWGRVLTPEEIGDVYFLGLGGVALGEALPVPEPSSFVLAGLGLLGVGLAARRRRRAC